MCFGATFLELFGSAHITKPFRIDLAADASDMAEGAELL